MERGVQCGREKRTKIYDIYITFSSKAVLQGLCSEAVLQGVLEKGSSMLLGIRKTGKCWTKVIFLQNMELKLKHQNPFHKSTVTLFERPEIASCLSKLVPGALLVNLGMAFLVFQSLKAKIKERLDGKAGAVWASQGLPG